MSCSLFHHDDHYFRFMYIVFFLQYFYSEFNPCFSLRHCCWPGSGQVVAEYRTHLRIKFWFFCPLRSRVISMDSNLYSKRWWPGDTTWLWCHLSHWVRRTKAGRRCRTLTSLSRSPPKDRVCGINIFYFWNLSDVKKDETLELRKLLHLYNMVIHTVK